LVGRTEISTRKGINEFCYRTRIIWSVCGNLCKIVSKLVSTEGSGAIKSLFRLGWGSVTNWGPKFSYILVSDIRKLIIKNLELSGAPLPVGPPVTRRSSHPIVTPLVDYIPYRVYVSNTLSATFLADDPYALHRAIQLVVPPVRQSVIANRNLVLVVWYRK